MILLLWSSCTLAQWPDVWAEGIPGSVLGVPGWLGAEHLVLLPKGNSLLAKRLMDNDITAVIREAGSDEIRVVFEDDSEKYLSSPSLPEPTPTGIANIDAHPASRLLTAQAVEQLIATLVTEIRPTPALSLPSTEVDTSSLAVPNREFDTWLSKIESTSTEQYPDPTPTLAAYTSESPDDHTGRYRLAMRGSHDLEVTFEIEPSSAQAVSFSVETVGASNGVGKSSTHAEPSSKSDNNNGDGKNHIPQSGTPSYPSETKSLGDRSAIQTNKITSIELRKLILEKKFSNDVRYQIEGNLYLASCTGLTALPENLSVGGFLFLDGCTGLTALPENLSVGGSLYLRYCTGLTALPENLSVGGSLSFDGCTGLTTLPENLSVGGSLYLWHCTGLTALPENLSVGGDLYLNDCTGLTALPNWITTMGLTSQNFIRHVYLENSGLSDALIDRMRTIRTPNMQFHFSRSARQPEQQFSNLEQGFAFWRRLASSNSEMPELDLRHDQADDLVCYLGRLTGTADYQNLTSRPVLAQRVMAVMSLLAGNDRVRETALRHIHDALSSCDDRIILALDDLETLQLLTSAETLAFENRDPRELKALGMQMMRLDAVKRFARDHMKTLSWVDAIEVELAFQIGVRQQLDLPGSTQHMIFRGCANVSDQDIANAVQHVNTHCSETQLEVYLAQWAPWQKFQRLLAAPSFDQLASTTVASIDDCFFCRKKTNKMVMLSDIHLDYDALVKAYLENGKNPFTNTPMDWSSVVRLIEEAPPLF